MSTINIKCVDQVMTFTNMPIITAGDKNVDKIQFDFCPLWDGFVRVAVFFQQKTELSYALINADGSCNVPNSIMKLTGQIFIAVTGVNTSSQVRTSNILSYTIDEGIVDASLNDEFPGEISEEEKNDIFNKILEMCIEMQTLCQDLITNFAYVQIKDANEFEYDESKLEAKIRAYTYSKTKINELLDSLDTKIGSRITSEVKTLNTKISNEVSTLNSKIDEVASTLGSEVSRVDNRISNEIGKVNDTIMNEITMVNAIIDEKIDDLGKLVANDISDINASLETLNVKITELNTSITAMDARIKKLEQ